MSDDEKREYLRSKGWRQDFPCPKTAETPSKEDWYPPGETYTSCSLSLAYRRATDQESKSVR